MKSLAYSLFHTFVAILGQYRICWVLFLARQGKILRSLRIQDFYQQAYMGKQGNVRRFISLIHQVHSMVLQLMIDERKQPLLDYVGTEGSDLIMISF